MFQVIEKHHRFILASYNFELIFCKNSGELVLFTMLHIKCLLWRKNQPVFIFHAICQNLALSIFTLIPFKKILTFSRTAVTAKPGAVVAAPSSLFRTNQAANFGSEKRCQGSMLRSSTLYYRSKIHSEHQLKVTVWCKFSSITFFDVLATSIQGRILMA